ncbi:MAG TPA: DUF6340 family protein [Draconibacterium sp.]|nr:DUF6340 family protein [Draconibacterium sp.]
MAVRYNNCNISLNPTFSKYYLLNKVLSDTTNIDSIAAEIYYQSFLGSLQQQHFFDSIVELEPGNYSNSLFINLDRDTLSNTSAQPDKNKENANIRLMGKCISTYIVAENNNSDTVYFYPETGLYTKNDLKQIADSTQADLLITLDYFASIDRTSYYQQFLYGERYVFIQGFWNLYDLNELNLAYSGNRIDTVSWEAEVTFRLPPRRDAILNAAEISGSKFAEIIVPHWSEVERLYYRSKQIDLVKAEPLIKEGKWLEAAKIWRANINSPNKSIAAKCMFNMGLACEMEGEIDAAIDWVVRSYQIFKQKNKVHEMNCKDYINILGTRKMDFKRIEFQLNPEANSID